MSGSKDDSPPTWATFDTYVEPPDAANPPPPVPERFSDERVLGRGGIGEVWLRHDHILGRHIAEKRLLDGKGARARRRFEREARVTAQLQHPGIVPVHDAGIGSDGQLFYTMKYVRGTSMRQALDAVRTLEDRLALVPRFAACCQAVAYAHSRGVLHRDLKPANIMLGDYGETIVVDWGLARFLDELESTTSLDAPLDLGDTALTVEGSISGTPAYMSPEAARGQALTLASDVYCLGGVLYFILSGTPPHGRDGLKRVLARATKGEHTPLETIAPGAPGELIAIVEKALSADPSDRYPDARGFTEDLEAWMAGRLVDAYHYTRLERMARWVQRYRIPVVLAGLGVAATLVGTGITAGIGAMNVRHERDRALANEADAVASRDATRKTLATALADRARIAVESEDPLSGQLLAAKALTYGEEPLARGILARFWDEPTPELVGHLPLPHDCRDLIFVGADSLVCAGDTQTTRLDSLSGRVAWSVPTAGVRSLVFDPADSRLGVGGLETVAVLDAETGTVLRSLGDGGGRVALGPGSLAWSGPFDVHHEKDGVLVEEFNVASQVSRLAIVEGRVQVLSLSGRVTTKEDTFRVDGKLLRGRSVTMLSNDFLFTDAGVLVGGREGRWLHDNTVAFTSDSLLNHLEMQDGIVLGAGVGQAVIAWDLASGRQLARLPDHGSPTATVATRPNLWATSGGHAELRLWRPPASGRAQEYVPADTLGPIAVGSDGTLWGLGRHGVVLNVPAGRGVPSMMDLEPFIPPEAFGERLGLYNPWSVGPRGDDVFALYEGGFLLRIRGHDDVEIIRSDDPYRYMYTTDDLVVLQSLSGHIHVYPNPEPIVRDAAVVGAHAKRIMALDRTRGTLSLMEVDGGSTRTIWTRTTTVQTGQADASLTRLAVPFPDGRFEVRDARSGEVLHTLVGHTAMGSRVLFIDENTLVTGSWDETVRIWDLSTNTERARLLGHKGKVSHLAYDGERFLYSTSFDNRMRAWDLSVLDASPDALLGDLTKRTGLSVDNGQVVFTGRLTPTSR